MKPHLVTLILVSSLFAASALCVGVRHATDQRRQEASVASRGGGTMMSIVVSSSDPVRREETPRRETGSQALASRLRSALATANPADRYRTLLAMAENFTPEDWPEALAALAEMGISPGTPEHDLLLSAWVEQDISAARSWAAKDAGTTHTVMRAWLGQDPDAALSHLLSPEGRSTPEWNLLVARTAVQNLAMDPPRLARVIAALSEGERRFALPQARPAFPAEDAKAVGKWLEAFDPAVRGEMLAFRMKGLSRFEDKTALAHAFPDDMGPDHYRPLYQEWAAVDKEAAATALQAMEPGEIQEATYHGVVYALFQRQEIAEAVEAFRAYPDYANESLLGELLLSYNLKDAELLMSLVPEIKNPDLRLARYRELLHEWLREDSVAARKWMAENEVPEQVRRQLESK